MAELRYIELSFVFQECVILVESLKNRFHTKGKVSSFFCVSHFLANHLVNVLNK